MDPLETLDLPWDTSLRLLRGLASRGHENFLFTPPSLSLRSGQVNGRGYLIRPLGGNCYHSGPEKKFNLADFDAVLIRKDPPFDTAYLSLTYLLEPLARKTQVINHPRGIRDANEKLFGLSFSRWSPPTLVSARLDEIFNFQKKIRADLVIKPLYEKGGKGVFLLRKNEKRAKKNLEQATQKEKEPVIAQEFIPLSKEEGDKRILLWKGEILGAFLRIPPPGDFRTNLSLGGRFVSCQVSAGENRLVRSLRSVLLKEGLYFVGIDVRAGKLIETNVTSPAGLVELDRLYGNKATRKVAEGLEKI